MNDITPMITIAYPVWGFNDDFISRHAYETDFVRFLMNEATILELPIEYIHKGYEFDQIGRAHV
jgi:hypothetical protein